MRTWFLGIACSVNTLFVGVANAQITPDSSLPNNSDVKVEGNINRIEGGTTAGTNLFHSFKEFSVPTGSEAHFNNAVDISNIITRVTGKSISNIDGLIKANGAANLFLINPSGIVFGENARLDIGGSFVGSTADAIGFGEGDFFSASNPENSSSLLNVNPNALFFNQVKAASIQNNSVADAGLNPSLNFTARGLRVPDGNSLLLVGGDINMDGGGLFAFAGRVELGGLEGKGTVGLNVDRDNLSLSFPDGVERSDVILTNSAGINVSAGNGVGVTVEGRIARNQGLGTLFNFVSPNNMLLEADELRSNVNISASTLQIKGGSQVSTSTFGAGKEGNLTVDAKDVQLIGTNADGLFPSGLFASTQPNSTGDAGNLTIKTNTLLVRDDAQVSTSTFGEGKGGNLTVNAKDVKLIGTNADGQFPSGLFASAQPNSTGDAGNLTIKTNTLLLKDGAQVGTGTFGNGKGGNLTVNAQDVQVIGTSKDVDFASALTASTQPNSTGDAGDLTIKTNTLLLKDGGQLGNATSGAGKGGDLTVDATEVQLIGTNADGQFPSGLFASAQPDSTGDAGDLRVNSDILQIENRAKVSVETFSTGTAGILTVNANSIRLNDDALLTANTRSNKIDPETEQATININSQDLIMRRGSNILTNAEGENVVGGNINIDTDILATLENSDISANSENFRGGNVRIEAQGIFGTQFRPEPTPQSDITATGVNEDSSGTVEIITPDTDTNSGLVNLPTIPVETEVAQACAGGSPVAQSRFEIIGLNGLPPNPSEALTNDAVLVDLVTLKPEDNKRSTATVSTKPTISKPKKIVEATGFMRNEKGETFLVADASNGTQHSDLHKSTDCRSLN